MAQYTNTNAQENGGNDEGEVMDRQRRQSQSQFVKDICSVRMVTFCSNSLPSSTTFCPKSVTPVLVRREDSTGTTGSTTIPVVFTIEKMPEGSFFQATDMTTAQLLGASEGEGVDIHKKEVPVTHWTADYAIEPTELKTVAWITRNKLKVGLLSAPLTTALIPGGAGPTTTPTTTPTTATPPHQKMQKKEKKKENTKKMTVTCISHTTMGPGNYVEIVLSNKWAVVTHGDGHYATYELLVDIHRRHNNIYLKNQQLQRVVVSPDEKYVVALAPNNIMWVYSVPPSTTTLTATTEVPSFNPSTPRAPFQTNEFTSVDLGLPGICPKRIVWNPASTAVAFVGKYTNMLHVLDAKTCVVRPVCELHTSNYVGGAFPHFTGGWLHTQIEIESITWSLDGRLIHVIFSRFASTGVVVDVKKGRIVMAHGFFNTLSHHQHIACATKHGFQIMSYGSQTYTPTPTVKGSAICFSTCQLFTDTEWSDRTHYLTAHRFKRQVFVLMCVREKYLDPRTRPRHLPALPMSLWLSIFYYLFHNLDTSYI